MTPDERSGFLSFWTTLPGVLTGVGTVLAAVTALLVAFHGGASAQKNVDNSKNSDDKHSSASPSPTEPPLPDVSIDVVRADPFDGQQTCPVTIDFTARISAIRGNPTVTYRWLRDDHASAPVQTLTFDQPGSQDVTTQWMGRGTAGEHLTGWEKLEVLSPIHLVSDAASFDLQC